VKYLVRALLSAILLLVAACDPGMTVHQTKSAYEATNGNTATDSQVAIHVKTTHQLIGETWYMPEVQVTNSDESPISITGVELAAQRTIFANKPPRPGTYPLVVLPGRTEILEIWFDLDDDVWNTFQQPAELRVHYRRANKEGVAHASVIGGRLDARDTP
jgi:hypothetical protein